jgi:hypothetical protein
MGLKMSQRMCQEVVEPSLLVLGTDEEEWSMCLPHFLVVLASQDGLAEW